MKNSSILIISNDAKIGREILNKIKLLRECDSVKLVSYIESISVLNSTQPSLILVYYSNSESISIIKEIRLIKSLDKIPVIFVMPSFVEEVLIYAFDNGIDDFFFLTDNDSIILMRIFLTLQKSILYKQIEFDDDILISTGIKDNQTGIYKKEYSGLILKNLFNKSIEENLENTVFMYLKPVSTNNKKINLNAISDIIKKIPRGNDIITYDSKGSGYYFVLYNAGIAGAKSVAERINKKLDDTSYRAYAVAAEITASFEEMESVLHLSLKDQISAGLEFNYLYNLPFKETAEVMEIKDETGKNFKDFKKEFFDNFEQIVAPVFYQIQTFCSEKYPDAKVLYNTSETESSFVITQENISGEMIITYPSYVKVIIDIKYKEGDKDKNIKRLIFDFEDFSQEKLTSVLNDLIKGFIERINLNVLYKTKE